MRWNALRVLPVTLAMGVFGCQSDSREQDAALAELQEQVSNQAAVQQAQAAQLQAAQAELLRLEAEKSTRAELDGVASIRRPWSISIPVESARYEGAAAWHVGGGGGGGTGLVLPETGISRIHVGFTLPDDYVEGADLELRVTWAKDARFSSTCNFRLVSNEVRYMRPGEPVLHGVNFFRGDVNFWDHLFPAPADNNVQRLFVDLPADNANFRPRAGDHVSYALFRDPAAAGDSCTGPNASVYFLGMSVHPKSE